MDTVKDVRDKLRAKKYLKILKDDLSRGGSCLHIETLVAHIQTIKVGYSDVSISDQGTLENILLDRGDRVEPSVLVNYKQSLFTDICGRVCTRLTNPSEASMNEIYSGRWAITGETIVSTCSLGKWARLRRIDCIYADILTTKQNLIIDENDIPDIFLELAEKLSPLFHNDELIIALKAEYYRCKNGTTGTTKKYIQKYLKEQFGIAESSDQSNRIATLLTPKASPFGKKKGAGIIMPSYDEFLRKNKDF